MRRCLLAIGVLCGGCSSAELERGVDPSNSVGDADTTGGDLDITTGLVGTGLSAGSSDSAGSGETAGDDDDDDDDDDTGGTAGDDDDDDLDGTTGAEGTTGGGGSTEGGGSSEGGESTGDPPPDCLPLLAEVLYDIDGSDDDLEWVKLYNPCDEAIDLSGFSLGWGGNAYTYGSLDLSVMLPAGGCVLIGGPMSSAANFDPDLDQSSDFNPDLQNDGGAADGVALFDMAAASVAAGTVPIDAVIYGGANDNELLDADGDTPAPHVGDAEAAQSIRRTALTESWEIADPPTPNACPEL